MLELGAALAIHSPSWRPLDSVSNILSTLIDVSAGGPFRLWILLHESKM